MGFLQVLDYSVPKNYKRQHQKLVSPSMSGEMGEINVCMWKSEQSMIGVQINYPFIDILVPEF